MSQSELSPRSAASLSLEAKRGTAGDVLRKYYGRFSPWFWSIVIVPTVLSGIYFFLIASSLYMSETRFIVRSQNQQSPSFLGSILQTAGVQSSTNDASAVESFMTSREAARDLERTGNLRGIFARPEGDFITRFPSLVSGESFEKLYNHYLRFVEVTLDSSTGVTILQVKAYRPHDAQDLSRGLLLASERLVNTLNARAEADAVAQGRIQLGEAESKLFSVQQQLAVYRNREQLLDPKLTSGSLYANLGGLMTARSATATQIAEMVSRSPGNPSLPGLRARLGALNGQLSEAMGKVTGDSQSVAGKMGGYERLALEEDLATKMVGSATQALETARLDAQSKHLYIEHIAEPSLPDYAMFPKRLLDFCISVVACLLVYGIAWLLLASVREHGSA